MAFAIGMDRPTGYATWKRADGRLVECDTFTCWHCNSVVFMPTAQDAREMEPGQTLPFGHCLLCQRPICGKCADEGRCVPFERKLDQLEARDRLRRAV